MDEPGGDTLLFTQPAAPVAPLTRKGKPRPKNKTLSDTRPGAPREVDVDAFALGVPSSNSSSEFNLDGQTLMHEDASDGVQVTQPPGLTTDTPRSQPKRRGRPPKVASDRQHRSSAPMAVAPRPSADRRPSASSVDSFHSTHVDGISSTLEKKTRLRARNREAAHKCRVRKQRGIEDLQTQEAAIGAVNQNLKNQYAELRSEVILLKDMVLQHSGCGCSFIESYIEDAAATLSQRSDSFTTNRHGSSSSGISPAASWSPASTQGAGSTGFATLEDGNSRPPQYDWDVAEASMPYHEVVQMGNFPNTYNGNNQGLVLNDIAHWMGPSDSG
ncbi:predicted protein [Verticillium alfalfae VaMs.102]|uniref:Predicted protein n=1 Tax=Verticillium alfalfae (strain VaMs.102 / ATCC MYA-4576 / FGSC 10136) TaxID=526221 RepID=C9SVN4_VERA1|nr:predicted protein [Verticillium alfalfae VaMs.102]EEY22849.1 predicted protein [Verticillium alfalfae VaMs.102]